MLVVSVVVVFLDGRFCCPSRVCVADGVGFFLRRGGALTVGKGGPE